MCYNLRATFIWQSGTELVSGQQRREEARNAVFDGCGIWKVGL
jgi:hypothetical protein